MRKDLYKLIAIFTVGICIAIVVWQFSLLEEILSFLLHLGPLGPLIAGILFAFSITIPTGGFLLSSITETQPVAYVALWAGLGCSLGDFLFFYIIKNIRKRFSKKKNTPHTDSLVLLFSRIEHSPLGRFLLPVIGAVIIASPLPDEIGVALLGISHMKPSYFFLLSFALNTSGIYLFLLGISIFS